VVLQITDCNHVVVDDDDSDDIDLGDLEGEASTLDSIPFATRLSFSSLPHVQSNGMLSSISHIQIPLTEPQQQPPVSYEPPHETIAFRRDSSHRLSALLSVASASAAGTNHNSLNGTPGSTRPSSHLSTPLSTSRSSSPPNIGMPSFPPPMTAQTRSASTGTLNRHALGEASFPSLAVYFEGEDGTPTPTASHHQLLASDVSSFASHSTSMASISGGAKRKADPGDAALPLLVTSSAQEKRRKIFVAGDSPNGEPSVNWFFYFCF